MAQNPNVTVIIPAYNAAQFLAQTIESVQAQTHAGWELIVIDDGSQDGTAALAQEFAELDARIRVVPQENGGVVRARNRGFAETRPDIPYIAYLDHDDIWKQDFLATLLPLLEADPSAVGAQGVAQFIDGEGAACRAYDCEVWPPERLGVRDGRVVPFAANLPTSFAVEAVINCIATPGQMVMRRKIVEEVGLFREDCNPSDDWDLYLRMTQRGNILFTDKIVMGWRQHSGNVSKDAERMERMMRYVRHKLFTSETLSAEHRRLALIGYRHTQRVASARWLGSARTCLAERRFARAASHTRFALQSYVRSLRGSPADSA